MMEFVKKQSYLYINSHIGTPGSDGLKLSHDGA